MQQSLSSQQSKQPPMRHMRGPSRTPAETKPAPINKDLLDYFSNHELQSKQNKKGRAGGKARAAVLTEPGNSMAEISSTQQYYY